MSDPGDIEQGSVRNAGPDDFQDHRRDHPASSKAMSQREGSKASALARALVAAGALALVWPFYWVGFDATWADGWRMLFVLLPAAGVALVAAVLMYWWPRVGAILALASACLCIYALAVIGMAGTGKGLVAWLPPVVLLALGAAFALRRPNRDG